MCPFGEDLAVVAVAVVVHPNFRSDSCSLVKPKLCKRQRYAKRCITIQIRVFFGSTQNTRASYPPTPPPPSTTQSFKTFCLLYTTTHKDNLSRSHSPAQNTRKCVGVGAICSKIDL